MRFALALLSAFLLPGMVHAQGLLDAGTGGLRFVQDVPEPEPAPAPSAAPRVEWVDVAKMVDAYRIPEKLADLRGVTVDASGKNAGFYFASGARETFAVYRNGLRMLQGKTESIYDMREPVVFRMTASGDLLYAVHGTDLYVNATPVSVGGFSFSMGADSVHDEGGVLTYPQGGSVMSYDIASGAKKTLYRHAGAIQYARRAGDTVAYTVLNRGVVRVYRDGRLVSPRGVENPRNFALAPNGDVYFFTKAARGYALFRNARSYATGRGAGAYVGIDPKGVPWHVSYEKTYAGTTVRLQQGRRAANLLPAGIVNLELAIDFVENGYALRAAFDDQPDDFYLIRDGDAVGKSFAFEYPYNDSRGFVDTDGGPAFRAYDGTRWRAYVDGEPLADSVLKNAWFLSADRGALTVYASK